MSYGGSNGGTYGGNGGWAGDQQAPVGGWPDEQQNAGPGVKAEDLVIGDDVVMEHDVDAAEKAAEDRRYFNIDKPGQYRLVVTGFGKVKKELKDAWVQGQKRRFEATSVTVFFGDVRDTRYQISDVFILPPSNVVDRHDYNYGSTKPDGSTAGFHAEKFSHFINRLIGGFSKGQALPPAAKELKNWIGRQVDATVKIQAARETKDPATGEKKVWPARAQIELYSYRSCGTAGNAGNVPQNRAGNGQGGGATHQPLPGQQAFPGLNQGSPAQSAPFAPNQPVQQPARQPDARINNI